jgi:hypothetical protein
MSALPAAWGASEAADDQQPNQLPSTASYIHKPDNTHDTHALPFDSRALGQRSCAHWPFIAPGR